MLSKVQPGDRFLETSFVKIATEKSRDEHDRIIVSELMDGLHLAVCKENGIIIPKLRDGSLASTLKEKSIEIFLTWISKNEHVFKNLLQDGERLCGEWMTQQYGTSYKDLVARYFIFDIIRNGKRVLFDELSSRIKSINFPEIKMVPILFDSNRAVDIQTALARLGKMGMCNALDYPEGVVYRVERKGSVEFCAKFVCLNKDKYAHVTGNKVAWNSFDIK
jgi:hypothetical protein